MEECTQKRQRALSGADAEKRAKRVERPFAQPGLTVGHATATGSARMLNGIVHGDNIHGNVNTTINNFHAGPFETFKLPEVQDRLGILSESEKKELMEHLRFPQLDSHLTSLRKAETHTCSWITQREDYKTWLESDDLKAFDGLFWIKGNPGTGKSIIMKFLYQRLQRQLRNTRTKDKLKDNLVIAFFFNARGNKFERSTLGLYRSLLYNLFTIAPNLQNALGHCQKSGYHNILESGWQIQMLKEVLEEVIYLLRDQGKQLYCYVDALDECPQDDVQDMISYFEDIVGKTDSRHVRVCFSSRHYPQIFIRTKLTMTLEKERGHIEDIKIFIESQLRFDEDVDAELLRQIRTEILRKSSGIFLWVNLVVHQLNQVHRQDGRMKAVQQRLREMPEAAKHRPAPNGAMPLYSLFQDIIQKDEMNIEKLVRITQIIFCARRPLRLTEVYVLLQEEYNVPFDSNEITHKVLTKQVLEHSKGLAEVTKTAQPTVQFIHETVIEFLRDGGLKFISEQSVDRDGHELLKASCLKQIYSPVSEHLKPLAEYKRRGHYRCTRINKITGIDPRQEFWEQAKNKFPFLEYASRNVLFHADAAEAMGISQNEFLESFPIAEWIPVHNLFESLLSGRWYSEATTPLLYVLAEHGCDRLIENSHPRAHYLQEVTGNRFSSAFTCAIFSGNLDSAWTLAGLKAKSRPQDIVAPSIGHYEPGQLPLIRLLLNFGNVHLMRRVLEDLDSFQFSLDPNIDFRLFRSAEMIDLLLEFSVVPGFPPVGHRHKQAQASREAFEHQRPKTDLISIRRAIEEKPSLLELGFWGGKTMLHYALDQRLQPLVLLYLDLSASGRSDLDAVLHHHAARGNLDVKMASGQVNVLGTNAPV